MELPVEYIVSEVDLKPSDVLLPLYECVVNAIISLKKTEPQDNKKIQIQITRGNLPKEPDLFNNQKTIKSIKVIDNGNGFTSENLSSYQTAYSRENKDYGCKGVGRFTVLAAFDKIEVNSNYVEGGKWNNIVFELDPISGVQIKEHTNSELKELKTIVYLKDLHNEVIRDASAKSVDEIAEQLMNHLLIYYLSGDLPRIEIFDTDNEQLAVVNDKYRNLSTERERPFNIGNHKFRCYITKIERTTNRKNHYIYYCANSRVVGGGKNLSKINSLFMYPISEGPRSFFLDVYLVSDYLNKKVYNARNGFSIPYEKDKSLFDGLISYEEIDNKVAEILASEYDSFVKETQQKNNEQLKSFIKTDAPQYRRFANKPEILNMIPPNLTDEKKEEFLHRIAYQERKRIEKNIEEFINKKEVNEETINTIKDELADKAAYDVDSLTDYIFRRKAIIDIFKKFLEADAQGDYKLEEDIHNLIFPMGVTTNDVNYDSHNLWLLDERFATYSYIASDIPITRLSQKKGRIEPDLIMMEEKPMIFNNRISFASSPSGELQSMVVFEFKRPGEVAHQKRKTDYRWDFAELITKYFDEFLYGQDKKNYKGRPVIVDKNTPKYGYVIVDVIPPLLKEYNINNGFKHTPFGTLYRINPDLNMHLEVITFEQLIKAVETRHAPFFNKLFA